MRLFISLLLLMLPSLAAAENPANQTDYMVAYAGLFDISQQDDEAGLFGAEYRYKTIWRGLRPTAGAFMTSDKAVYGYGGFYYDFYLTDNLVFSPNLAVGAFSHGDGKKLGHGIEFRDGLELSYQFDGGERLGFNFYHMSNASIGSDNPGTEILMLVYQEPLSWGKQPVSSAKRWWK